MKRRVLLLVFICSTFAGLAQVYTVVRLKGVVLHNGKPLKEGDTFNNTDKLNTADPAAALRVLSSTQGSFVISFQRGLQQSNFPAKKRSELFELVAGEYIKMFNPGKAELITKGGDDFDWFNYFYRFSSGPTAGQLSLLDGQHVSTASVTFPAEIPYQLFSCVMHYRDSMLIEIPIANHQMIFKANSFPDTAFYWKLKIGYKDDAGKFKLSTITETAIRSRFISITEFENMAAFFFNEWDRFYESKDVAENAFRSWVNIMYGATIPGPVENMVQKYLP